MTTKAKKESQNQVDESVYLAQISELEEKVRRFQQFRNLVAGVYPPVPKAIMDRVKDL